MSDNNNNTGNNRSPSLLQRRRSSRRSSKLLDLSKDYSRHNLQAGRQAMTADLSELEKRLITLQKQPRGNHSPSFNPQFWNLIQALLKPATDVGFSANDDNSPYHIRTLENVAEWGTKIQSIMNYFMPLDCHALARLANVSLEDCLIELIYAAAAGLVDMNWTTECQGCGGSTERLHHLNEFQSTAHCPNCSMEQPVETLEQMKVLFKLNESILYFPTLGSSCPHSPEADRMNYFTMNLWVPPPTDNARATHWSYLFGMTKSYGNKSQPEPLEPGRYRLHCPFSTVDCYLDVRRAATPKDKPIRIQLKNSEMVCPYLKGRTERTVFLLEHGKCRLDFLADRGSVMALWVYKDIPNDNMIMFALPPKAFQPYAHAADLVHLQAFQTLFANQVVSQSAQFAIQTVYLVFTDVVSSTDLYESAGDGLALETVQEHFQIVFGAFESHGRIVKTIGDAVMGAFISGEKALYAVAQALEEMEDLTRPDGSPFQIRIGMHTGAALVVPLNGINDYFGKTVNIAARVESQARRGECLISESVVHDPSAQKAFESLLEQGFTQTRAEQLALKGVPEPISVRGFCKEASSGELNGAHAQDHEDTCVCS